MELIFTTLPNHRLTKDGEQYLLLSVHVAVRLKPNRETTLQAYPDMLGWPEKILATEYQFRLANGSVLNAELQTNKIDPELFGAIFNPTITVKGFEQENLSNKLINSVPLVHIKDFVLNNYKQIAIESPTRGVSPDKFIDPARFGPINRVKLDQQQIERAGSAQIRRPLRLMQLSKLDTTADEQVKTNLRRDKFVKFNVRINPQNDFAQLRQFHGIDAKMSPLKPFTIPKPRFEFHDILAVSASYPQIMRRYGFILDFLIPYSTTIPYTGSIALVPGNIVFGRENTKVSTPSTAYQITQRGFYIADRPGSIFSQGFVKINSDTFSVVQVDADGAAIKATTMAESKTKEIADFYRVKSEVMVSRNLEQRPAAEPEPPGDEGLPSVRSSGIGIVRNGMAEHVSKRFESSRLLQPKLLDVSKANMQRPAGAVNVSQGQMAKPKLHTASPLRALNLNVTPVPIQLIVPLEVLYSDDLVQGYRMDVAYQSEPNRWYSLHQRKNEYTYFDVTNNPNPVNEPDPDEGFLELALTQSTEDQNEIFVPETLARWEGWSLSVRRPGFAINEADDDPAPPGQKKDFVNKDHNVEKMKYAFDPSLNFKLHVDTKPVLASLPKLRFGIDYRLRIRAVDIAGNSVGINFLSESERDTTRSNIRYMRYEPLASPIVLVGNELKDGEFLESMVVRSNFDKSAQNYERENVTGQAFPGYSHRFLLPPKNSQLMAESHGMFEKAFEGNTSAAQVIYDIITKHEGLYKRPDKTKEKVYKPSEVEIIYLPDPMAAGVAFFVAEGYAHSHTQDFKPLMVSFFSNQEILPDNTNAVIPADWYNAKPVSIRLEEGNTAMTWSANDRTLTVWLPKGLRTRLKYSTFWREADFRHLSGIWKMVSDEKPQNLAELERLVKAGQHWMLSPPGEFELVHAVQQPVEAPEIRTIISERDFNDTTAKLHTRIKVHGQSTGKIELHAKWEEPIDDGLSPEIEVKAPGSNLVPELEVIYHDEVLTYGTIPEPRNIPQHVQMRQIRQVEAIPVQRLQVRTQADFQREPQPQSARLNTIFVAQNQEFNKIQQARRVAPKNLLNQVKFDIEENRFRFVKMLNLRFQPITQSFGDTKHRWVDYQLVASTRYEEYFAQKIKSNPNLKITRESTWWEKINILSTARPALPRVDYVIPTFEWRKIRSGNQIRHQRLGGGLRVYLERPWFSSGADEMLAVVLPPAPASGVVSMISQPPNYTDLYTHWALDPILPSVPPGNVSPQNQDFRLNPVFDLNLQYPGMEGRKAGVAAYPVVFDERRQQWFCDLAINPGSMYFPFVKLALARYQPYSVKKENEDVCLSPVVLTTFVQLVPERQTTVNTVRTGGDLNLAVTVEGTVFGERIATHGNRTVIKFSIFDSATNQPVTGIVIDGKTPRELSDLGDVKTVTANNISNNRFSISQTFRIPQRFANAPLRMLVEEFETGPTKTRGDNIPDQYTERLQQSEETDRLIYADVIEVNSE